MVIEILKTGIAIVLGFYQIYFMENILKFTKNFVGTTGFEPVTSSLQGKNQLILGSTREYQLLESMKLSSYKKISESIYSFRKFVGLVWA